jgi:hypothetical protein
METAQYGKTLQTHDSEQFIGDVDEIYFFLGQIPRHWTGQPTFTLYLHTTALNYS